MEKHEITLELNSPITKEQWDYLTDVELERSKEIEFRTPSGKTVLFQKVKRGRWVSYPECLANDGAYADTHIVCSRCNHVWDIMDNDTETFNYCPNCGAKMEAEQEADHE